MKAPIKNHRLVAAVKPLQSVVAKKRTKKGRTSDAAKAMVDALDDILRLERRFSHTY